MKHKKSRG